MEDKAPSSTASASKCGNHGGRARVLRNALPDDACRQTGWGE